MCVDAVRCPGHRLVVYLDSSPFRGGAQRSFGDLIEGIRGCGIAPYVLAADRSPGGVIERCVRWGIGCRHVGAHHWGMTPFGLFVFGIERLRWRRALGRVFRSVQPALVHANGIRGGLLAAGSVPAGVPLVLHDRDTRGASWVLSHIGRRVDRVIAISESVSRRWAGHISPECVSVIHNGLPVDRISRTKPTDSWPPDPSVFSVVLVADLLRWKAHDLFLAALGSLKSLSVEFRAAVVGRIRDRRGINYLRELQSSAHELGIADWVLFRTDERDAWPWISAADVLVSAASNEPFGRTVVEALALGKPVVAVRGGGPDTILANCAAGVLVDSSPVAIAQGLRPWAEAGAREGVNAAARERARQFGIGPMVAHVCSVYETLWKQRSRSSS